MTDEVPSKVIEIQVAFRFAPSMNFGAHDHPFYRPLWRRIAIVVTTVIWAGVELSFARDGFWPMIATAVCLYSIYAFLIAYPRSQ